MHSILRIHSYVGKHLGHFHLVPSVNNAAMNMYLLAIYIDISLEKCLFKSFAHFVLDLLLLCGSLGY